MTGNVSVENIVLLDDRQHLGLVSEEFSSTNTSVNVTQYCLVFSRGLRKVAVKNWKSRLERGTREKRNFKAVL